MVDWHAELVEHVPVLILRTLIAFVTVLVVVRGTGKRSVANLAPFDLALVILIGEVAAIPVAELNVEMLHGILPVVLVGFLHVLMTTINLHSKAFEAWTEGKPTLLVKDGRVLRQNLFRERVSMIDLQSALRHKEVTDLARVREAWMEPAGGVSVILKDGAPAADPGGATATDAPDDLGESIEQIVQANAARLRQELEQLLRTHRRQPGG